MSECRFCGYDWTKEETITTATQDFIAKNLIPILFQIHYSNDRIEQKLDLILEKLK